MLMNGDLSARVMQAFVCRVRYGHKDDLDKSLPSILFQRLSKSTRSWVREGESTWQCERCKVKNRLSKKRCFVCQGWVGGKHPFERRVGDTEPQPGTIVDAIETRSSDSVGHGSDLAVMITEKLCSEAPEQPPDCASRSTTPLSMALAALSNSSIKGKVDRSVAERERSSLPDSSSDKKHLSDNDGMGLLPQKRQARSIDTLHQLMSESSDDTMKGRMQMSIIQAACQHKKTPAASFQGADGNLYADIAVAFDIFSGISACNECSAGNLGVCTYAVIAIKIYAGH